MSNPQPNLLLLRAHRRIRIALACVVVAYIVFNTLEIAFFQNNANHDILLAFTIGAIVFQPMSFALWLVFGIGAFITRLPIVLISLGMAFVAAGLGVSHFDNLERLDFIALVLSGTAIFVVATLIFFAMRWFTRWRIEALQLSGIGYRPTVSFSMKYLLALTTLAAVALGAASQLTFHDPPRRDFFGPDFVFFIMIVGGAMVAGVSLPMVAVPILILIPRVSKRAISIATVFWFAVAFVTSLIWAAGESDPWPEVIAVVLLTQLGAGVAGALAALPLRLAGLRLVKNQAGAAKLD